MATSLSPRERGYPEELKLSLLTRKRKVAYLSNIEQTQLILGLFDKATATMQDYADFKAQLTEAIHGLRQKYQTETTTEAPKHLTTHPALPEQMEARLLTKTIKDKERQILTSLIDPMKYPASNIVDLYNHCWEIELGYRAMKKYLLENGMTLRSQLPELMKLELWGILLAYNLLRYEMILMAKSLDGIYPCLLSFREASSYIIFKLCQLPMASLGNVPTQVFELEKQARQFDWNGNVTIPEY